MRQPEEVLHEALAVLEARGHTKGVLRDMEGCVCARGAINTALTGSAYDCRSVQQAEAAERYLVLTIPEGAEIHPHFSGSTGDARRIVGYNNAASTSAEDVKLWFKRAAELARTERDDAAV